MQTYTSNFGTTPMGVSTQNLYDSLQKITGVAPSPMQSQANQDQAQAMAMQQNAPQFAQQSMLGQQQQAGIPGMIGNYADEAKMMEMFAHDQGLANKYTRPDMQYNPNQPMVASAPGQNPSVSGQVTGVAPTNQPSDIPTFGNVGVPQTPELTLNSLNQGYQGLTTPGAQNSAMALQGSQIGNALDLINKAIQFNSGQVATNAGQNVSDYSNTIQSLVSMANLLSSNAANQQPQSAITTIGGHDVLVDQKTGNILRDYGSHKSGSETETKTDQALNALQKDVQSGTTFDELFARYAEAGIPEYQIRQAYNAGPMSKKWGPAQETSESLRAGFTAKGAPVKSSSGSTGNWKQTNVGGFKILGNTVGGQETLVNSKTGMSLPMSDGEVHLKDQQGNLKAYYPGDPELESDLKNGWGPLSEEEFHTLTYKGGA